MGSLGPMLGYAEEHRSVLQALSQELKTLESQLAAAASEFVCPVGILAATSQRLEGARLELVSAQQCVQEALGKDVDDEWLCPAEEAPELAQAAELRRSAQQERQAAEATLLQQRATRVELLQRLQEVTRQNQKAIDQRQVELDKEAAIERQLKATCEAWERETEEIREEVLAQGRRLDARNTVTSFFQVPPRDAARRQAKAQQEAEEAKVILQLKRISDSHLSKVHGEQNKIEEKIDGLRAKHEKRMGELQEQWQIRKQKHEAEVGELQKELAEMDAAFEARWAEEDEKLKLMLEQQEIRGQEAIAQLEAELLRQSDALRSEVQAVQEESSLQEVDLKEVGDSMESEIKAQLELKKQAIMDSSDADIHRFQSIRKSNEKVTEDLIEEAKLFRQGIEYLRDVYSNHTPQKASWRRTRAAATCPAPSPYG